jgi:hypothetical protein
MNNQPKALTEKAAEKLLQGFKLMEGLNKCKLRVQTTPPRK